MRGLVGLTFAESIKTRQAYKGLGHSRINGRTEASGGSWAKRVAGTETGLGDFARLNRNSKARTDRATNWGGPCQMQTRGRTTD